MDPIVIKAWIKLTGGDEATYTMGEDNVTSIQKTHMGIDIYYDQPEEKVFTIDTFWGGQITRSRVTFQYGTEDGDYSDECPKRRRNL